MTSVHYQFLVNADLAYLQCMPMHFCVESKELESRMFGKPSVAIHHEMFEVVANGDLILSLS